MIYRNFNVNGAAKLKSYEDHNSLNIGHRVIKPDSGHSPDS